MTQPLTPREQKRWDSMFADDGCLRPNTQTHLFLVELQADCEHAKVQAAQFYIRATDEEAARSYLVTWHRIPRTHVTGVWRVTETRTEGKS